MVQWCPHFGCRCGRDACINSRLLLLVNAHVVDVVALAVAFIGFMEHWSGKLPKIRFQCIPITAATQHHTENSQQTQGPCLKAVDFVGWLCVPWGELNELIGFYLNSSSGPHTHTQKTNKQVHMGSFSNEVKRYSQWFQQRSVAFRSPLEVLPPQF